ncbi:MAG: Asp-tRNA(Asn)/Glu-tRNA(Gln) amidotransferase subunit GatB [Pirellulales bacterium]|nr:Asp-tRNA(Asn)/Glu-tRNA(Gln) amidotransferase subunit GatB [Pirellulales bacterium]
MSSPYTIVIGLEVHVQLLAESKMFCGCATKFGSPANTQTCPVCIGLPGSLPVMNRKAFELSVKTAVALNCEIPRFTKWDRKQYYYPDLPKGYQISQYDLPLSRNGYLAIGDPKGIIEPKKIGIIRAHLEEDAGKSMHDEVAGKADSRIDLNRAGTPLLEIVSEPDLRSPAEAKAYLTELKLLLNYLGVSDCNMQEGSLRVDANINLHLDAPEGKIATPIVEVKNMNSFRAVERALTYEAERQWEVWQKTGKRLGEVPKTTRGWDESAQVTREQRSKEESSDYRYFPDPDLVPVIATEEEIAAVRASLGELPAQIRTRLETTYGITSYDSDVIVNQGRAAVDFYTELAERVGDGKTASNWLQQDVLRYMNERQIGIERFPISAKGLAELLAEVKAGRLETGRAREVFQVMLDAGKTAAEAIESLGIVQVDDSALIALCRELLAANPKIAAEAKAGQPKGIGQLIGQAKKKNPNVNPARFKEICLELIAREG